MADDTPGGLTFVALMEAYLQKTQGYLEPTELYVNANTRKQIMLLGAPTKSGEELKLRLTQFLGARIVLDSTLADGEFRFAGGYDND